MRRALAIASLVAIVLALLPVLGTVPGTVAHAATISVVCDGVQDATQTIQPAINSAVDGDIISISAPNGFCDIDFPVQVTHAVTLTSASAPTKVAFKGPEVTAVSSLLANAQASATARMSDAKAKVSQLKSSAGASATGATGTGTPGARSGGGQGNGTGGGAGVRGARKAANAAAKGGAGASTAQSAHDVAQRIWNSTTARLQGGASASFSTTTGPGIAVYPNLAPVTIQYLTITGFNNTGNDDAGGAIIVGSNTRVTIQNNEIRLNAAARGGGIALIENNDGSLIKNNVIQNNLASCTIECAEDGGAVSAGGAIFAFSNVDNLEISNNYLDDNVAINAGGAVLIGWDADDLKFLANSCVANLAGAKGGCLHIVGSGYGSGAGGDSASSRVAARDVVVFRGLGQSDRAQFNGNQFLQNQSGWNGGAVNIGAGNGGPTFTNNRFEGNFASGGNPGVGGGGAVNIQEQARQVTFTQNQLIGNSVRGQGGAIRLAWQSSTCGSASPFTGNTLSGNAATLDGGAIHFAADADCTRLTGNTYSGNSAGTAGGAVSFSRRGGVDSVDVVIDSDQYLGNASGGSPFGFFGSGFGGGGAIHFGAEMHNLQIRNNTKFQGNTAAHNGGALDFECNPSECGGPSSSNVKISNAQFTNNATTGQFLFDPFCSFQCGFAVTGMGGAIFFGGEVDDLLMENVAFTENRTAFSPGGAVAFGEPFVIEGSASSMAAKLAQNNKKPSGVSASQLCCSDNVVLRNTQFLRNAATNSGGGAIFVDHEIDGGFTIDTGLFDSNKASGFGGESALYWGGGAVLFAAYVEQPTITKSQFINNSAIAEGGALYFDADSDGLRITGQTLFRGNSAVSSGGAIAVSGGDGPAACVRGARIDSATFDGNKSNDDGGAIALKSNCSNGLEIDHSTFTRGTAMGLGGALILTNADRASNEVGSSNVRVHHNTFANNSSADCCFGAGGGGVAVIGASPGLRFSDNVLHHNTANQPGGNMAVYCTSCGNADIGFADMQLYNNTFAHGTSARYGGVFIHTDDSNSTPTTDPVAFWNNIAYLNLSGDFGSDSTPIVAWNSLIGAAVTPAVCSSVNACFALDPLFVNAKASDYHLQGSSPAINLGALSNPSVGAPQSAPADDRDNVLRVSPPDAGAYENPGGSPVTATPTGTILTATITDTPTTTLSPTPGSPTATPTPCVPSKLQPLLCATPTISGTATNTPTPSTPTLGPAETLTPTPTITLAAGTPAASGTPTITNTPGPGTPTATSTLSPTPTSTFTLTPTITNTRTNTPTVTLTRTLTSTPPPGSCVPPTSPKCATATVTG